MKLELYVYDSNFRVGDLLLFYSDLIFSLIKNSNTLFTKLTDDSKKLLSTELTLEIETRKNEKVKKS